MVIPDDEVALTREGSTCRLDRRYDYRTPLSFPLHRRDLNPGCVSLSSSRDDKTPKTCVILAVASHCAASHSKHVDVPYYNGAVSNGVIHSCRP